MRFRVIFKLREFSSTALLVAVAVIFCVLEGAIRKWVVGDGSLFAKLAYFSKDAALVLALFVAKGRSIAASPGRDWLNLGLICIVGGMLLSLLYGFSLAGTIVEVRTFIVLPILVFGLSRYLRITDFKLIFAVLIVLALLNAGLGFIQFFSPASSVINHYSSEIQDIATAGYSERVRACGTFSYIGTFGAFSSFAVWGGLVLLSTPLVNSRKWLGAVLLPAGLLCSFVTVSRGVLLFGLVLLLVWVLLGGNIKKKLVVACALGVMIVVTSVLSGQQEHIKEITTATIKRHQTVNDSIEGRMHYQIFPFADGFLAAPFGNGLGSEQGAAGGDKALGRKQFTIESPWGRIFLSIGILGTVGFVSTLIFAIRPTYLLYKISSRYPSIRSVAVVTGIAQLLYAFIGIPYNHVTSFLFWVMTLFSFCLYSECKKHLMKSSPVRVQKKINE